MLSTFASLMFALALASPPVPSPVPVPAPPSCRGEVTLENAARAYKSTAAMTDVARYRIMVPGAPPHEEVLEFGFDPGVQALMRMPSLYVLQVQDGRLIVRIDGENSSAGYLAVDAGRDLQKAVDEAFGGQGAPLVPIPLLLRDADSSASRVQAFRLKMLAPLHIVGCRNLAGNGGEAAQEVRFEADNGSITARFDTDGGWLLGFEAAVVPAPGQEPIRAKVQFSPRAGVPPAVIARDQLRAGAQVSRLADLSEVDGVAKKNSIAGAALTALDGSTVHLENLRGSLVVLEFWATWCAPCRMTLPAMRDLARWAEDSDLPLHVLLVNTEENFTSIEKARPVVERYLAQAGIDLPSLVDIDGALHRAVGGGLPLTILIDQSGAIVETHGGFDPGLGESLRLRIQSLLRPPPNH
jgi:thiol-disulfide isomerase/thioredoxin